MKTIKAKVTIIILTMVISISLLFGIMSCVLNYQTANQVLMQALGETAVISAERVSSDIKTLLRIAIETGCNTRLGNSFISDETKINILQEKVVTDALEKGNIIYEDGISIVDGKDYSQKRYFQAAMKGEAFISDPEVDPKTGESTLWISAPLWRDGIPDSVIIGAICFAPDNDFLNHIVSSINLSDAGFGYILNQDGTTVADIDTQKVGVENSIRQSAQDSSLTALADVERKMIAGKIGTGLIDYEGARWVQGYAPIEGTDGWSLGVMAPQKDFLTNFYLSLMITVIAVAVFVVLGVLLAVSFGNQIGNPVKECARRISMLAQGDLKSPVCIPRTKDETFLLATSTQELAEEMSEVVNDIASLLGQISQGNLDVTSTCRYMGDFIPLKTATDEITLSLNEIVEQLHTAAELVASGSNQVSGGAQALSEGASEQASSIDTLSTTIDGISIKIKNNAQDASAAKRRVLEAETEIEQSNQKMQTMVEAIAEISTTSKEIEKIIKTIEDIAFQTNILALNAAVEAARAGVAGKGFAVVADEVRNLASKSAQAAQNTTALIEDSLRAVKNGTQIADDTAKSLGTIINGTKEVARIVTRISDQSQDQAQSANQITQGVEEISTVVLTNSATAQESAAASEELSSQAQMLRELVSKFKLKGHGAEVMPTLTYTQEDCSDYGDFSDGKY